jgi:hypothetical protein
MATATRTPLRATPRGRPRTDIRVLDNPLTSQDAALARAVETTLHDVLDAEDLGVLEVRFRVCRELPEGLRFICKVENPPLPDIEHRQRLPLRWWSPLMETVQDFRAALQEAIQVRRERAHMTSLPAF